MLTQREKEIALLLLREQKRELIALSLGIHVRTVDFHLRNMRRKMGVYSAVGLAVALSRPHGGDEAPGQTPGLD